MVGREITVPSVALARALLMSDTEAPALTITPLGVLITPLLAVIVPIVPVTVITPLLFSMVSMLPRTVSSAPLTTL